MLLDLIPLTEKSDVSDERYGVRVDWDETGDDLAQTTAGEVEWNTPQGIHESMS